ncbi:3-oxoacyl-ACP reductase FabG [Amycolatopsis sp. K13G38]|uniref:3-oxoacyl-ACP reductase FabG n=1 Tax=Amycolatopsis acididurans TaxID=2724524 RepID=A0ABX1J8Y4_9PSEU|nr:3-oxoacyl-ACP reductase FabG [Amycolatopsis acididurans]NKQ56168.1 3-oxoacyl-ACP reductase FabG [Amycolatopsis acididurans]
MAQVAIVTGGGRGIGATIAQRLAAQGCAVGVLDLDLAGATRVADEIAETGMPSTAIAVDVADTAAVESAVGAVTDQLGAPSILINNAGVTRDNLLFRMSDEDWDLVLRTHLRGCFLMARAVQKTMVAAGYGRIVNISSASALGNRGQANYAAAKAGIQGFTKTLALELGPYGITVNCVAPGFIVSDMTRATARRLGRDWEDYVAERAAQIPVRRAGTPEDVASVAGFLCSPDAGFVSGQVVYVAGGPKG